MLMCIATSYLLLQLKVLALPAPGVVDTDVLSSWDQIYEELQQQPIFRSAGFPERSEDVINYKRRFDRSVDCTESAFRENSHSSHDVNESNARFIASEEDRHVPRQVEKRRRVATEVLDDSWAPTVTQPGDSIQFTRNLAVHPEHYPAGEENESAEMPSTFEGADCFQNHTCVISLIVYSWKVRQFRKFSPGSYPTWPAGTRCWTSL
ncbi:hypothetical protein MJO29_010507 [Puccinia striiformis f. sp. tritici]|nr:hypothetical protein MJO29_010507 [Puccinia striiformis f. sp. tritici]